MLRVTENDSVLEMNRVGENVSAPVNKWKQLPTNSVTYTRTHTLQANDPMLYAHGRMLVQSNSKMCY